MCSSVLLEELQKTPFNLLPFFRMGLFSPLNCKEDFC
jgi:hypothetical protein